MKVIITEEERNRILGLYKQVIIEQPIPNVQQVQIGKSIINPAKDINIGTTYITFADENGDVTNGVRQDNGNPIYCKVVNVVENVNINGRTYKMIKAINNRTNKACSSLNYNGENGWMGVFVNIEQDGEYNLVSGSLVSPTNENPNGSWSFDNPYARSNEYSLFSTPVTAQNTTQAATTAQNTNTTVQSSNVKYGTDNSFDYMLKDGKYYFKGKSNTTFGTKYPKWIEAKRKGLKYIKSKVRFQ